MNELMYDIGTSGRFRNYTAADILQGMRNQLLVDHSYRRKDLMQTCCDVICVHVKE